MTKTNIEQIFTVIRCESAIRFSHLTEKNKTKEQCLPAVSQLQSAIQEKGLAYKIIVSVQYMIQTSMLNRACIICYLYTHTNKQQTPGLKTVMEDRNCSSLHGHSRLQMQVNPWRAPN